MQELVKKALVRYEEGPYPYYRIPGLVVTAKGTILTYFEARLGKDDWQTRGIGIRRSEDDGDTWSPLEIVNESKINATINNPIMIAAKSGRVYFMWEEDYCRGFIQYSDDDGITFSTPIEITTFIEQFYTKRGYRWDVFAFGPGHGIELNNGELLVTIWLANGGKRSHHPSVVSTIVSYDLGKTWEAGEIIYSDESPSGLKNPSETCAVQLDDGSVLLNIRHEGKNHYRAISVTPDGLKDFSEPIFDRELPDPICCGGIVRTKRPLLEQKHAILFSNCAIRPSMENHYSRIRAKLTLRLSLDNCKTWKYSRLLEECAGYSDVAFSNDNKWIYCIYEHDHDGNFYSQPRYLTFSRVNIEWLSDGEIKNCSTLNSVKPN